jgi:hypothetical protein
MRKWIFLAALALTTIFCSVNLTDTPALATPTPDLAAIVKATLTAVAAATGQVPAATTAPILPSETPALEPGTITGKLSYPSEGIPSLRIVAFEVGGDQYHYILTLANQDTYTFELPVGVYHIVAYTLDGTLSGGYSRAVPCGLAAECADHSLIDVTVTANTTTSGIDPGDWYANEGDFPPMPAP